MNFFKFNFLLLMIFSCEILAADFIAETKKIHEAVSRGDESWDINFSTEALIQKFAQNKEREIGKFFKKCYLTAASKGHAGLMYNFIMRFEQWRGANPLNPMELAALLDHISQKGDTSMLDEVYEYAKTRYPAFINFSHILPLADYYVKNMDVSLEVPSFSGVEQRPLPRRLCDASGRPKGKNSIYHDDRQAIRGIIQKGDALELIEPLVAKFIENLKRPSLMKKSTFLRNALRKFYLDAAKNGHKDHMIHFINLYESQEKELTRAEWTSLLRISVFAKNQDMMLEVSNLAFDRRGIEFTSDEIRGARQLAVDIENSVNPKSFAQHNMDKSPKQKINNGL